MKNYILAAALIIASTNAMASRVVSGVTKENFSSKAEACGDAKNDAELKKNHKHKKRGKDEKVVYFSKCDCDQDKDGRWTCSVDATLEDVK